MNFSVSQNEINWCFFAKNIDNFIRIVLPKVKVDEVVQGSSKDGGVIGGVIGGAIEGLADRQLEVLELIHEDNKISYRGIAKRLDINESAVGKHIDALKEKGVLKREGGTRGFWKIINPNKSSEL
ncbi:MAG: winged helix-turn-helix transcriptional regulator [Fulvivirga sp.]